MNINCKKCGSNMICTITETPSIKYKSDYIAVPFDYSVCALTVIVNLYPLNKSK